VSTRKQSVLVKPTAGPDVKTTKAIDDLRKVVDAKKSLLDGAQVIENVRIRQTEWTRLKHGLGRRPVGYSVARSRTVQGAVFFLYDDNDNRTDADQWLYLKTLGDDVIVDVLVY
jgi:hypothetical protein